MLALMSRVTAVTKQTTRARLLAAAAQEFARAGLERASVDAISLAAGYAKGTIYNYFASKEELFLAGVEEASAQATASSPAIAGLADLALVDHWSSGGARPALEEIPQMVLTLLLGTRSAIGDP